MTGSQDHRHFNPEIQQGSDQTLAIPMIKDTIIAVARPEHPFFQSKTGNLNEDLELEGILRTMYDPRNSLTSDVSKQLRIIGPDKMVC